MKHNLILKTDSYKPSHFLQYPKDMTYMQAYLCSRGGKFDTTIFFGLQHLLKEYLSVPIAMEDIEFAENFMKIHGVPFNREGWEYIVKTHNGYLPIKIRAVKEGSNVPTQNVLMIVESTDKNVAWAVGYVETLICKLWYPITVCTQSFYIKQILKDALEKSCDDDKIESKLNFMLHDFGYRGVSSEETAGIGGMAHLVNFMGSDTINGILYSQKYYNTKEMTAFSISASEHSTMTCRGRKGELEAMRDMIKQFGKPGAMFACVSDSYNIYDAIENYWCGELLEEVKNSGATVVIRPDSGNPVEVVLSCLKIMDRKIGCKINSKGYKVLPDYFRIIQGDGVCLESIKEILNTIHDNGFSSENITFGSGGALLQKLDRDTQKFAYKISEVIIDNKRIPVYKNPITDFSKKSRSGHLDIIMRNNQYETIETNGFDHSNSLLQTVFENGKILKEYTFEEIRKNVT